MRLLFLPLLFPALATWAQPIVSPSSNARAVARTSSVTATFGQALPPSAASALKIYSAQRGGLRSRATTPATVSGNTLRFTPTAYPFLPGETINTTITTAAPLARAQVLQFTAAVGGQGRGSFIPPTLNPEPAVGMVPSGVTFGDVDGDGDVDLLTANANSNTVSVRVNNGTGNFTAVLPDVAVTSAPVGIALADVDGDGDLDLITSGIGVSGLGSAVSVRLNDGTGRFTVPALGGTVPVGSYASGLAVGDVDGDGDLDLLTSNAGPGTVSVRLNDGNGVFTQFRSDFPVGSLPFVIALGDLDADGDLDIVTSSPRTNTVVVSFNDGQGNFGSSNSFVVGSDLGGLTLADVDGDSDLDLLTTTTSSGTVSVRLNNGAGSFLALAGAPAPAGTFPVSITAGDLDADGDPDLVVVNNLSAGTGTATILRNNGAGQFATIGTLAVGRAPQVAALADVDGDGDLDVAITNYSDNTASVRLNGGTSAPGVVRISGLTALCSGGSSTLTAQGTPTPSGYLWNTGANTPSILVTQPGTYSVTATFPDGQTASVQQVVTVGAGVAPFSLGPDTTLCEGSRIVLRGPVAGAGVLYQWSDGSTASTLAVTLPGTYSLRVSNSCGEQVASRSVAVRSCLRLPTIITANGDGVNDFFAPVLAPGVWSLAVYSRWGQRIYQSGAYANEWGNTAAPGMYYYLLQQVGESSAFKGWVEVVR